MTCSKMWSKKAVTAAQRRQLVTYVMDGHRLSERRACHLLSISRSVYRYQSKKPDDGEIAEQLLQLAKGKPRWGFGKMFQRLPNQGYG